MRKKIKPTYKHPEFVVGTADKRDEKENKRLWLSLIINKNETESLVVIMKNPSRATKDVSDKTIFNVTNYVYKNREKYTVLKKVGTIIFLNLIPFYETYSDQLKTLGLNLIDKKNQDIIIEITSKHKNVIVAWGNHPKGLSEVFDQLKKSTIDILRKNKNNVFYVDKLTKNGNPKHGQVWSYSNELLSFK